MSNILRIPPRRPPPPAAPMDIDVPQIVTINQAAAPSSEIDYYDDDYVTDEEEVDQIIDDDAPTPVAVSPRKVNGKGKGKAKAVHVQPTESPLNAPSTSKQQRSKPERQIPRLQPRKPGETYIDQQRVEKIMKAYGDILPPSKDAVFLVSLATQEFIHRLAMYSSAEAKSHNRSVVKQKDLGGVASIAELDSGLNFLQETIPRAIPLSTALAKRAVKENERILIATEFVPSTSVAGIGSANSTSHKKRQPPLPKNQMPTKGKTRTSARQANGRSSLPSSNTSTSLAVPRPKRAAAQKGRVSWADNEKDGEDDAKVYDINRPTPTPTPVLSPSSAPLEDEPAPNGKDRKESPNLSMGGRGGIIKGLGPGAYGKIGGSYNGGRSSTSSINGTGQDSVPPRSWGYSQERLRNTGRTIYSDRTDEEARKAAAEAEEQIILSRARQKFEQELMVQDVPEEHPNECLHP